MVTKALDLLAMSEVALTKTVKDRVRDDAFLWAHDGRLVWFVPLENVLGVVPNDELQRYLKQFACVSIGQCTDCVRCVFRVYFTWLSPDDSLASETSLLFQCVSKLVERFGHLARKTLEYEHWT